MNAIASLRAWSAAGQLRQDAGSLGSSWPDPFVASVPLAYEFVTLVSTDTPAAAALSYQPAYSSVGTAVRTNIAPTTAIGTTGNFTNQDINGILGGYAWDVTNITYSFPTSGSFYGAGYPVDGNTGLDPSTTGFQVFSASQKASTVYAFNLIAQYTGLTFTEITETASVHAMIRLAGSAGPPTSYAYYPYPDFVGAGDVWLGNVRNLSSDKGTYQFTAALLHEIGHAMGLKHGYEANATYGVLPAAHGFTSYSIMDYRDFLGDSAGSGYQKVNGSGEQTYMVDDIAALQYLYGANFNANSGQTIYRWSATTGELFINDVGQGAAAANTAYGSIWDGGGAGDLYNFSDTGLSGNMTISLQPGEWTTFNAAQIADLDSTAPGTHLAPGNIVNAQLYNNDLRSLIEDVYAGNGSDSITGNVTDNLIYGYGGNDTIRGLAGSDTAWFAGLVGAAAVTLVGPDHYQVVGAEGTDQLYGIERAQFGVPAVTNVAIDTLLPVGSTLSVGASTSAGNISVANEHDYYAISLVSGTTYWFSMEGSQTGGGTLSDSLLYLYSDDSTVAASNDDGGAGRNAFISYTASVTHSYWLDARGYSGNAGTYTLRAAVADDYSSAPAAAGTLGTGGTANGTIGAAGDTDWFALGVTAGSTYWLQLRGSPTGNGTLSDPELRVLTADGTVQAATNDDGGAGFNAFISYTAASTGSILLSAQGHGGSTGTYQLSAALADDYADAPTNAGSLAVGGSIAGAIGPVGDKDWFAVFLTAGVQYWLELKGSATGDGTLLSPALSVYGNDGTVLLGADSDAGIGSNAFISFTPASSGTFHLQAEGENGLNTGSYLLTATIADDFADTPATTGTAAPYSYTYAAIDDAGDTDWFATTLTAGTTYWLTARGGGVALPNPQLSVYWTDGQQQLATDAGSGTGPDAFVAFTPAYTDVYHIGVADTGAGTGSYALEVAPADDYADNPTTTGTIAAGGTISGTLNPLNGSYADGDWFNTTLTAGTTYWFQLNGSSTGQGSLTNPSLILLGDDGATWINFSISGGIGNNAFLSYTPTVTGAYQLAVSSNNGGSGTYTLIETLADDFPNLPGTAGTIADGTSNTALIGEAGDTDWFATTLIAGTTYWFSLAGAGLGVGTLTDAYLRLIDGNAVTTLAANNDSGVGSDAFLRYTPTSTGTYYLSAQGIAGSTGSYTLSQAVADDNAAVPGNAPLLKAGGAINGDIEADGDKDWFRVSLIAGKTYWFNAEGAPNGKGTLADTYLRLLGDDGSTVLAEDDDGGVGYNASISFTAAVSGNYYLEAGGYYSNAGTYRITAAVADDFAANPTTTGVLAPGDSIKGIISSSNDTDWFATNLNAGTTYWLGVSGNSSGGGSLADPIMRLYDDDGATEIGLNNNSGTGTDAFLRFTPGHSGTYHVAVQGAGTGTGAYHVTEAIADDFVNNPATTQVLAVGGTVNGTIEVAGDTDWVRVNLTGGVSYAFSEEGSPTGQGTLANPLLRLFGNDGTTLLASDNDSGVGANALLTYTPATTGTYHLSAQSAAGTLGTYRLGLLLAGPDTAAGSLPPWATLHALAAADLLPALAGPPGEQDIAVAAGRAAAFRPGEGAARHAGRPLAGRAGQSLDGLNPVQGRKRARSQRWAGHPIQRDAAARGQGHQDRGWEGQVRGKSRAFEPPHHRVADHLVDEIERVGDAAEEAERRHREHPAAFGRGEPDQQGEAGHQRLIPGAPADEVEMSFPGDRQRGGEHEPGDGTRASGAWMRCSMMPMTNMWA